MVKLFDTAAAKLRDVFGSGHSERNASSSSGVQSADKPSKRPMNKSSSGPQESSSEDKDDSDDDNSDDDNSDDDDSENGNSDDDDDDDEDANTMPPPYDQATAAPGNSVANDCNESCLCMHHQGCCRMHTSLRTPNRGYLEQPHYSGLRALERLINPTTNETALVTGVSSALTLLPIHNVVNYHLSLDHLTCVRRHFDPRSDTDLVESLSCSDKHVSRQYCYYYWLNDIYFRRGTFIQRQQMRCHVSDRARNSEYFAGCPHQSLRIHTPRFEYKNGMLEIRTKISNNPPRCEIHPTESWGSSQGPYAQIVVCTICHSDAECTLQVDGAYLKIEYTCYRDLGPGTSPTDPKWLALLIGEGTPHRQKDDLKLYARVWGIGRGLGRLGISEVTHQTPNGPFNARDELYGRRGNRLQL
ncbi:hypothetical protein HDV64DRAFT_252669 [Trichoderma sp. TUCIM 5745]